MWVGEWVRAGVWLGAPQSSIPRTPPAPPRVCRHTVIEVTGQIIASGFNVTVAVEDAEGKSVRILVNDSRQPPEFTAIMTFVRDMYGGYDRVPTQHEILRHDGNYIFARMLTDRYGHVVCRMATAHGTAGVARPSLRLRLCAHARLRARRGLCGRMAWLLCRCGDRGPPRSAALGGVGVRKTGRRGPRRVRARFFAGLCSL